MFKGQGARVVATVVICMVLLIIWPYLFGGPKKKKDDDDKPAPTVQVDAGIPDAETPDGSSLIIDGAVMADGAVAAPVVVAPVAKAPKLDAPLQPKLDPSKEVSLTLETPHVRAVISSFGGALSHWVLKDAQFYEWKGDKKVQMDMVKSLDDPARYALALDFPDSTAKLPRVPIYTCTRLGELKVECVYTPPGEGLKVTRSYTVDPEQYTIDSELEIENATSQTLSQTLEVKIPGYQDPDAQTSGGAFSRKKGDTSAEAVCYLDGKLKSKGWKKLGTIGPKGEVVGVGEVGFGGYQTKYFLSGTAPYHDGSVDNRSCAWRGHPDKKGAFEVGVRFAKWTLKPGEHQEIKVGSYIGPKLLSELDKVRFEDVNPHFGTTVSLGWLSFIARPMLWLMRMFYGLVPNWGLAIILLTIVFKLLTLPLVTKQMRSMRAMSRLKPKMEALKEKYKDDKQRQNLEMMNLYKANNINPLGGCLPMLIQMPIWFALYRMLGTSAELYQAPFVGWLDNLTSPDRFYVVPALLGSLMFAQQRISPQPADNQQAKLMMWMMPIMFTFFSLFFPSGLSLYILTNTILSIAHQYYMNKTDPMPRPKAAAPAGGKS